MDNKKLRRRIPIKDAVSANALTLNVAQYSSKKENTYGVLSKLKVFKDNKVEGKVKYQINQINLRNKVTANETYDTVLQKGIGSGKVKNKIGIGKKKADISSDSAFNLGLNEDNPRMLARQIASWKVARSLNMRVISNEKYALDSTGDIMGISAMLSPTAVSLKELMEQQSGLMDTAGLNAMERQNQLGNVIFSGKIQKELSDLQLLDALTGQTDRHHGNIFIDITNQSVYGIDNDQAFGSDAVRMNENNAVGSFKVHTKLKPNSSRFVVDDDNDFEFIQEQIDINSAEKILAMSESDLQNILNDKVGSTYGEYLNLEEIDLAKKRLRAMKVQILKLKKSGKLIKTWDNTTYTDALGKHGGLVAVHEGLTIDTNFSNQKYQSYLAREVYATAHGKKANGA